MNSKIIITILAFFACSSLGNSQENLGLPFEAQLKYEQLSSDDDFAAIIGTAKTVPKALNTNSQMMLQQVWQIEQLRKTTGALLSKIKTQLTENNFKILFECDFKSCGGFDFRFNANIINEPNMHVDLGDYKFLTAKGPINDNIRFLTYIISKGARDGFIQINTFGKNLDQKVNPNNDLKFTKNWSRNFNDIKGSIILEGLKFKTGSSEILKSNIPILSNLANYLILNKHEEIILVGHTDASGNLKSNIKLSKQRAESVRKLFIRHFGVNPDQISTNGIGFLAPIASNETKLGRERNRRVEIIIMPKLN